MELEEARTQIREVDEAMRALFVRRMEAVRAVAAYKAAYGLPVEDAAQEARVLGALAPGVADADVRACYERFLRDVMANSKDWQRELLARVDDEAARPVRILVINGPNLNLLGLREPDIYGTQSYAALCELIEKHAADLGICVDIYQSNHEGDLVDVIQGARGRASGIVINPGAYTHTSVALLDALRAVSLPAVEVHLSDVNAREAFRAVSFVRPACVACIAGHGVAGYIEALDLLVSCLSGASEAAPAPDSPLSPATVPTPEEEARV